ncbi:hypothetical protein LCM23_06435 [Cytobacillus kochii]|uniref:hypothetical protein n=1 Tax=Cytobacillus kochii TaxID=859143 RepID=UPI001CD541C4|nr:hypothetical protein [Cytobacillus kochii]MCA1025723.1 hypothetical protein [Cytobacillus kochii]
MKTVYIDAERVVREAIHHKQQLMGDDFIGFKFIKGNSVFWNSLLNNLHSQGENVAEILNSEWLRKNEIPVVEFDHMVWRNY